MRTLLLCVLLSVGCGAGSDVYYARFEHISEQTTSPRQLFAFQDQLYAVNGRLVVLDGPEVLASTHSATVLNGRMVAVTASGVQSSEDGQTFDIVSDEIFEKIVAVDSALVATRLVGWGTMQISRSEDGGATWTDLGDDYTIGVEQGTEGLQLSPNIDGVVWARVFGDADIGVNYAYTAGTFEVRGESVIPVAFAHGQTFPTGVTPDRRVVMNLQKLSGGTYTTQPHDELALVLLKSYSPDMADIAEQGTRVSYAMPDMPLTPAEIHTYGLDESGRLLATLDGQLVRSEQPLTQSGDQTAEVLVGPGCSKRRTFDPVGRDRADLSVTNNSAGPVSVWAVDQQSRWHRGDIVQPGQTAPVSIFAAVEGTFLMALDADGNCAAGAVVKEGVGEFELTVP